MATPSEKTTQKYAALIVAPMVTEKTSKPVAGRSRYTFIVSRKANKYTVSKAMQELFSQTPKSVNMVVMPDRVRRSRYGESVKQGIKKAVVTFGPDITLDLTAISGA